MYIILAHSQSIPYKEIKFKNLNPLWIYAPIDSAIITENNDGRNHFANISDIPIPHYIDDNYLYIAHHIFSWTNEVEGALLEKINLTNGNIEWSNKWGLSNNDRQEWVESIFIDGEGYLNVITDKRIVEPFNDNFPTFNYFGDTCLLSIRKFNTNDGVLFEHIESEIDDSESIRIKNNVFGNTILYPVSNTKFQYYEFDAWHGTISLYNIDENGHPISDVIIDTVQFMDNVDISIDDVKFTRYMVKVSRDTFITLDILIGEPNSNIDTQNIVTIYDGEMNVINKFRIDSLLKYNYEKIFLKYANKDFIHIYGRNRLQSARDTNFYLIVNYNGELQRQFTGVYKGRNHSLGLPLYLEKENEYLQSCFSTHYYGLDFVLTNPNDSTTLLKEFYINDIDYGYYTNYLEQLENGDILAFGYTSYFDDNRYVFICPTIMRIKAEDLGIESTSTDDISFNINKLLIAPNPVKNNLKISSENLLIRRILVFSILGELIIEKEVNLNNIQSLNVENLGKGIYIIKAYDDKNKYEIGKFIKQ